MKKIHFELIGSILIIRKWADTEDLESFSNSMLKKYPSVKTVVIQTTKVSGVERTRNFKHFKGIETLKTAHMEYGNCYELDISTSFFSPRLSYERQRIAKQVKRGETIINFFSGVGPFSIAIASKCKDCIIHSIELNEDSYRYLLRNIEINHCIDIVKPYHRDAFDIVPKRFKNQANRILLPLPLEAERALPIAYNSLKEGIGTIHWQITEKIQKGKTSEDIEQTIKNILESNHIEQSFQVKASRIIRWLAPRVAHKAIDLVFG
jgi:tRNA (guanine37-N1)-methyltransferase